MSPGYQVNNTDLNIQQVETEHEFFQRNNFLASIKTERDT